MPKTPKRKTPSRLPALSPLARKGFQAEMDRITRLSQAQKDTVMASLNAAANPNAEDPLVVIQTLEGDEKRNVQQASMGYSLLLNSIGARGRNALMMDSEIDVLAQQESEE